MHLEKIQNIKLNPNNPRLIKDDKFKKLCQSLKDFPEMLELRPIVVNKDMIILGGNMRYKAAKEIGLKEIPVTIADLTEDQQREFLIKDNTSGGEWDWEVLANEWDNEELESWGLDVPSFEVDEETEVDSENPYTAKVEAPIYEPKNEKPLFSDLYNKDKFQEIIKDIEDSSIEHEEKEFLKLCATRHLVFTYSKIADFYSHSNKQIQGLMEDSALIIIDFNKAIEKGFVKLTEEIANQYIEDFGDE